MNVWQEHRRMEDLRGRVVRRLKPRDFEWLEREAARWRAEVSGEETATIADVLADLVKRARRESDA